MRDLRSVPRFLPLTAFAMSAACDPGPAAWAPTGKPQQTTALRGVGLSPPSYDATGFLQAFDDASAAAEIAVVQFQMGWGALHAAQGEPGSLDPYNWLVRRSSRDGLNLFERHGLQPAVWMSFAGPTQRVRLVLPPSIVDASFANPEVASAYVDECIRVAAFFEPAYLALGVEIDSYLAANSEPERTALLASFERAYTLIKDRHPQTAVFMYFQYENVVAAALWDLIAPFVRAGDVAAFSSYPFAPGVATDAGRTAGALPDHYYDAIVNHLGSDRPIGFTELGHPSRPSGLFAAGSETAQAAFVERFLDVVAPLGPAFVVWTYLYDADLSGVYGPAAADFFGSMGLLRPAARGRATPAWRVWASAR